MFKREPAKQKSTNGKAGSYGASAVSCYFGGLLRTRLERVGTAYSCVRTM